MLLAVPAGIPKNLLPGRYPRRFYSASMIVTLAMPPPSHIVWRPRSEEHTSELQSLMRISYAVFCLKKKNNKTKHDHIKNEKRSESHQERHEQYTHHRTVNNDNNYKQINKQFSYTSN